LEPEKFVLAPEVIRSHDKPEAFVEPAKIPQRKSFKKVAPVEKEQLGVVVESLQPVRPVHEEKLPSLTSPLLEDDDEGGDNQYLEDMLNKPPSPIITRKRDTNSVGLPPASKSSPLPVDAVARETTQPPTGQQPTRSVPGISEALEKVKRDLPLQSLKRHRVLQGVPRIFPANLFPGELRKDSCYGGTELKPVLVTEHLRRNERGRGPLLCAKCNE
jgi:hypothetical protein